jgi:hypothetical protein
VEVLVDKPIVNVGTTGHIDRHKLNAAIFEGVPYSQVTDAQRKSSKSRLFFSLYAQNGEGFPMVTTQQVEAAFTRDEIVEQLQGRYCVQCRDHESKTELAEALAENMNTEGDSL